MQVYTNVTHLIRKGTVKKSNQSYPENNGDIIMCARHNSSHSIALMRSLTCRMSEHFTISNVFLLFFTNPSDYEGPVALLSTLCPYSVYIHQSINVLLLNSSFSHIFRSFLGLVCQSVIFKKVVCYPMETPVIYILTLDNVLDSLITNQNI